MRSSVRVAASISLAALYLVCPPGLANEPADLEHLLAIIDQQQQQLEAQQVQIERQRQTLQALRRDVEALRTNRSAASATASQLKVRPPTPSTQKPSARAQMASVDRKSELKNHAGHGPTPEAQPESGSAGEAAHWPGAFNLPGTDTQMKISGFVELDAIHDTDAIGTPTAFVTSEIFTRDKPATEGADGQTNFSVQASRLVVETKTPIADKAIKTFVSADWFGDYSTSSPNFRLRKAYGEISDILFGGDLLIGQAWSTVTDLTATPNVLDFQGPNGLFGDRRPMLRWTKNLASAFSLKLAAEAPDLRSLQGASPVSRWPDTVAALNWQSQKANLTGVAVARDLRASAGTGTVDTVGWGASLQGRLPMPGAYERDFATFSLTYGEGIGGLVNDAPPDAVYNPRTSKLKPVPTLAWFAGYQHWWNAKLYSVVSYGQVDQDTLSFQEPTSFEQTRYATANLTWTPFPQWLLGVELMYGSRKDKDGAEGSDVRTQFTSRFAFP